jgi:hypothetical protein
MGLCDYFDLLEELYGFYGERTTPKLAFADGIINAEELEWLLDD